MGEYLYSLNPIAVCSFLTVSCLLVFAFSGLLLNPRARTNQAFAFMCMSALLWNLGIGFMLCSRDAAIAENWYRFSYLGVVLISPGVFLFTSAVTRQLARNRGRILAAYGLAFLFALEGILGRSTITGMREYAWGFYPRYGSWSLTFLCFFFLFMAGSFQNLVRRLHELQPGMERRQIKALIIAFSVAYLGAWDFLPCFGVPVHPYGFFAIVGYMSFIFWSVYRYQLLNPSPESLAREVLATIADSIIVLDADGFVRMVNPEAEELLGYPQKELLRRHFSSLVDPRSANALEALVRNLSGRKRSVESGIFYLRNRQGGSIPTACNLSTIRDWKGRVQGVVLACRDMRERFRSREIIQEQEGKIRDVQEWYTALFNRGLFAAYMYDFEGNVLEANQAALDLLGYRREDLAALNLKEVIAEEQWPDAVRVVKQIVQNGRLESPISWKMRKKGGDLVWAEAEGCLIYRGGKPYAIQGLLRDITERKRTEEELKRHHERLKELVEERTAELKRANDRLQGEVRDRIRIEERLRRLNEELDARVKERTADLEKANEELKQLDGMKDSFLSSVSHELRTPLTSIRSFSEILLRYDQEDLDTQKEFLGIINSESERLTRLINDVLDLSRIEAGEMVWNDEPLRLQEVITATLPAHKKLFEEKSLRLALDLPEDLSPVVADPDRIQQVVTNLLANAIKFSREGGEIRVRVEEFQGKRFEEHTAWIKVNISDQGIGIDEKDFHVIFEKFRQVSKDTMKDKPEGTGLGLPICRDIILHYRGNIWVESKKGKGSTFCFTLPAADGDDSPETDFFPEGEGASSTRTGRIVRT